MVLFPKPLKKGDLIAVTAPSSGAPAPIHPRLDLVIGHLREQGYRVVEGNCLREQHKDASAPSAERAAELTRFLTDPNVSAIIPPWGGELAMDILELIDFEGFTSAEPKWLLGFSDISTLLMPLTLISGWATAHGANLLELVPTQTNPLITSVLSILGSEFATPITQHASKQYQLKYIDFRKQVDAALNATEPTVWKRLDGSTEPISFSGRLIGGCFDTVAWLAGSKYGDVPAFIKRAGDDGVILYLENVEMAPTGLVRALLSLKWHGWFEGVNGVVFGRNAAPVPDDPNSLSDIEALQSVLSSLPCPVLYDLDIGHRPPQLTLINGAMAHIQFANGGGSISQHK